MPALPVFRCNRHCGSLVLRVQVSLTTVGRVRLWSSYTAFRDDINVINEHEVGCPLVSAKNSCQERG